MPDHPAGLPGIVGAQANHQRGIALGPFDLALHDRGPALEIAFHLLLHVADRLLGLTGIREGAEDDAPARQPARRTAGYGN